MLVDLHARTTISGPSGHDPRKIIQAAKRSDLDGIAFVDRLQSSHAKQLIEWGHEEDFPVFIGVEIPTTIGRFLCFAPDIDPFLSREEWRQLMAVPIQPTYQRVLELFHSMGGAVLAAHPYSRTDGFRLGDRLILCEGLQGVEVLNPGASKIDCILAIEMAVKMGLPLVGGSDSERDLGQVGKTATLFADRITSQSELVQALQEGNFWAVRLDPQRRRERRRHDQGGGRRRSRRQRRPDESGDSRQRSGQGSSRQRRSRGRRPKGDSE